MANRGEIVADAVSLPDAVSSPHHTSSMGWPLWGWRNMIRCFMDKVDPPNVIARIHWESWRSVKLINPNWIDDGKPRPKCRPRDWDGPSRMNFPLTILTGVPLFRR